MDDEKLAQQEPADIDAALACMVETLGVLERRRDKRAVFLRVYWEMTKEVWDALEMTGKYTGRAIFQDPSWVRRLSGGFATLYFRALAAGERGAAWDAADATARQRRSTVLLNVLLGINAHINFDLARAIAGNLDPVELKDPAALQLRKFDHDQVNNLLITSLPRIQDSLSRHYAPGLGLGDRLLGRLDERLSEIGLSYYRERVWWDALAFAAARADDQAEVNEARRTKEAVVRTKLDWESHEVAQDLLGRRWLWRVERLLNLPWALQGWTRWGPERGRRRLSPRRPTNPHH